MRELAHKYLVILLIPLMGILNCPLQSLASGPPTTNISVKHKPVNEVHPGERVAISAKVSNEFGIKEVRTYFKAHHADDYSFIVLQSKDGKTFTGTLPAAAQKTSGYNYLLLVQTNNDIVVTTQTFSVTVQDEKINDSSELDADTLQVYTELPEVTDNVTGFSGNIAVETVEPEHKLGVIAGIYNTTQAGEAVNNSRSAGQITASTGISTTGIVIGSVIAAAVIGGAAAAGGGGGRGDGAVDPQSIYGTWNVKEILSCGCKETAYFVMAFYEGGTYLTSTGGSGTWSLSGSKLTVNPSHNRYVWTGNVANGTQAFNLSSRYSSVYFYR
jgi:hypothetical protein